MNFLDTNQTQRMYSCIHMLNFLAFNKTTNATIVCLNVETKAPQAKLDHPIFIITLLPDAAAMFNIASPAEKERSMHACTTYRMYTTY